MVDIYFNYLIILKKNNINYIFYILLNYFEFEDSNILYTLFIIIYIFFVIIYEKY
jgi:hypothetical protein